MLQALASIKKESEALIMSANSLLQNDIEIKDDTPYYDNKKLLPFDLRLYQKRIFHKIFVEGKRKIFLHWSRRAGKDACCFGLICTLALKKKGTYGYMLPFNVMAKKVIWRNGIQTERDFIFFKEFAPKDSIKSANAQEMTIELKNGSIIYVTGTDNYDRLRGIFLTALVMSEYAFGKPGVLDVLSPVLSQANSILLINTTPNGFNFSWNSYLKYKESKGWYTELETCETLVDENGNRYITEKMVQDSIDNGMSDGMVRQEFYCEPWLDENNLYFGAEIKKMVDDGRWYYEDAYIPGKQLHFALDIGLSDLTVMIGFQINNDGFIHVVYCYSNNMQVWSHYAKEIIMARRSFRCVGGVVFLPHDGAKRYSSGDAITTVEEDFNKEGLVTSVIPVTPFKDDAISDAKTALNKTRISSVEDEGLEKLRENLQSYKRAVSRSTQEPTGKPAHDNASHYADSYQTLAAAYREGIRSI